MRRFTRHSAQDVYGRHSVTVQCMRLCTCSQARRPAQSRVSLFRARCFGIFTSNGGLRIRRLLHLQTLLQQDGEDPEASETTEVIEQEVMVNLKHAAYLYGWQRCQTRRYEQVRELHVDRGSQCIRKCLQQSARRTCTFLPSV